MINKHTSFWFAVGLKFHENHETELLIRHLTLLAIFYHAQEQTMIAEGLFRRALDMSKDHHSFHRAFALKMYGHVLATKDNRKTEKDSYLKAAKAIEDELPSWSSKLQNLHFPKLD